MAIARVLGGRGLEREHREPGFKACFGARPKSCRACPQVESALVLLLLIGALSGCGGDEGPLRLQIEGRLTNAGEPLQVAGADVGLGMVVVEFYPLDDSGNPAPDPLETAHVPATGEFNLVDGIPPGRYRIAVRQWDPYPNVDRLEGRFSFENTKVVREITSEDETLQIDVSRPEG